ncbi:MAG TPA: cellulase family glycosylhydrolase [Gaiellaceae bacterium]|nr:cellulase family glycosylhydrolase [Gaiellaceae bacterium]
MQRSKRKWIGANFWSRAGGPRMWLQYRPDIVRQELQVLAEHGCTVTRSFCYWPDFVPEPERLDEQSLEHFTDFLDAHADLGLETIPTFIVGHMSGENWDPPWRQGRDLYRDVWLVSQQAWFVEEIVRRFHEHAVTGWLLSNEMPLYGGPASTEEVTAWARILVQAARAAGATQPISVGDGAWGVEVSGQDNGYSLRSLAPLVDFFGPHSYPMEDDQLRQFLTPAFVCELAGTLGKPVVLEEFGVSSDFAADDHAAAYYRQVLHTSLLAGARGWLAWNNCDFDDLRHQDPYRHHVFELHFGLTDGRGQPKPQLRVLRDFAALVSELGEWERVAGQAALVVPEHFERVLPFTEPAYRTDIRSNLLQAYIAAREADLPIELVRERDGLPGTARLYLVPCAKLVTAPGIDRLRELADAGATIYLSYFAGSTPTQRGPWLSWLDEIFGVRHRLRHGLVDPIEEDEVTLNFVDDLGDIAEGSSLTFRVAGEPSARAYLPLNPQGAEVVAIDGHGRPALLRNRLGAGSAVLCAYPLEHMAAKSPGVNPEDTWRIYSALAIEAGVERAVRVDDPRVLVGLIRSAESETALFVNCAEQPMTVDPIVSRLELDLPTASLALEPFGVAAVRCADASDARTPMTATSEGRDARP